MIVGNSLGNNALTTVSSLGNLIFLMIGSFNDIAVDAGVVIARYFGARDINNMQRAIRTIVASGLVSNLALTVLGVPLASQVLIWMNTPTNVLPQSVTYFHIYFVGSLGSIIYSIFAGILQVVGDSRRPLNYLIVPLIVNTVPDIILTVVFHMGVGSAAFATILSQFVNAFLCMNRLLRTEDSYRLPLCKIRFHEDMLVLTIHYSLPGGLQGSIIAIMNVVVQPNASSFGKMTMTGHGTYSRIEGFVFLPVTNFTMALTTSVDQNLGVCQYERAKKGAKSDMLRSMAIAEMIGTVIFLRALLLTAAFNNDPQVVTFGTGRARVSAMFFFLLIYSHCISAVLRGAGKPMVPMVIMLLFWYVVRVTFLAIMIHFLNGIAVVYWVYPLTWSLSSITFFLYHRRVN